MNNPPESLRAFPPLSSGGGTTPVLGASPSTAFAGIACSAAIGGLLRGLPVSGVAREVAPNAGVGEAGGSL